MVGTALQRIHEGRAWRKCQAVLDEGRKRLDPKHTAAWRNLYTRQKNERTKLEDRSNSVTGRASIAIEQRKWSDLYGAIRGKEEVVSSWKANLDQEHKTGRAELNRDQGLEASQLDRQAEAVYQQEIAAPLPAEEVTKEALERELLPQAERLEAEGHELSRAPYIDVYEMARDRGIELERSREMDIPW